MSTETLAAPKELADRNPRSQKPLADESPAWRPERSHGTMKVIAAFDGWPAGEDALRLSAPLARSASSRLLVVCVFPPESLAGISFDSRAARVANGDHRIFVRQDAQAVLAEARAALPDYLDVTVRALESESASHGICQLALAEAADALVLGSTRRGVFGRRLHRSLAHGLLRDPPCAVTVVPHDDRRRPVSDRSESVTCGRWSATRTLTQISQPLRKGGV